MEKAGFQPEPVRVSKIDLRIMVAVAVCYVGATVLKKMGILFSYGEMRLEILQTMTSAIACLLCCQDSTKASLAAGKNRLIITAVGGLVGMVVVLVDTRVGNAALMTAMVAGGVLLTLFLCKAARVPYINARIGGVTFILVSLTLSGDARLLYALFRFLSTLYGVLVVLIVTFIFEKTGKKV